MPLIINAINLNQPHPLVGKYPVKEKKRQSSKEKDNGE